MEALVSTGAKQVVIAAILGVHPSTVCRELAWNRAKGRRGHRAKGAQKQASAPETRGRIPDRVSIGERPAEANEHSELGHWEADTVVGARHCGAIVTAAERKSRFFVAASAGRKTKAQLNEALNRCMGKHKSRCESITFDNGREFSGHGEVGGKLKAGIFFADPYA